MRPHEVIWKSSELHFQSSSTPTNFWCSHSICQLSSPCWNDHFVHQFQYVINCFKEFCRHCSIVYECTCVWDHVGISAYVFWSSHYHLNISQVFSSWRIGIASKFGIHRIIYMTMIWLVIIKNQLMLWYQFDVDKLIERWVEKSTKG